MSTNNFYQLAPATRGWKGLEGAGRGWKGRSPYCRDQQATRWVNQPLYPGNRLCGWLDPLHPGDRPYGRLGPASRPWLKCPPYKGFEVDMASQWPAWAGSGLLNFKAGHRWNG